MGRAVTFHQSRWYITCQKIVSELEKSSSLTRYCLVRQRLYFSYGISCSRFDWQFYWVDPTAI